MKYFCNFHEKVVGITRQARKQGQHAEQFFLQLQYVQGLLLIEQFYIKQVLEMSTSSPEVFSQQLVEGKMLPSEQAIQCYK